MKEKHRAFCFDAATLMFENIENLQTQRWAYEVLEGDPLYENAERINLNGLRSAYYIYDKAVQVKLELFLHSKDVKECHSIFEADGCTVIFER